ARGAGIACVQNAYSLIDRSNEDLRRLCAAHGIIWVPFMPLGSAFDQLPSPADHPVVREIAEQHGASPVAVSLAWLLAHDANTALIPGTRSIRHLRENLDATDLHLAPEAIDRLD